MSIPGPRCTHIRLEQQPGDLDASPRRCQVQRRRSRNARQQDVGLQLLAAAYADVRVMLQQHLHDPGAPRPHRQVDCSQADAVDLVDEIAVRG